MARSRDAIGAATCRVDLDRRRVLDQRAQGGNEERAAVAQHHAERLDRGGPRAAWPQHRADHQADAHTQGDVLDADQSGVPTLGLDDVEQEHHEHRERCLPDHVVHRARRVGGEEDRDRQPDPRQGLVAAEPEDHDRRHPEPDERAEHGLQRGDPGAERIRPQHAQRAEHHPERVVDVERLADRHRDRETERGAQRGPAPHRIEGQVVQEAATERHAGRGSA